MIPLHLVLTNFLSYGRTTEIDFHGIHLACISGNNGAGKSTLLDAITWALFNKARKTDDSIIHGAEESCEVTLDFLYENTQYRIQRQKSRTKTSTVDFFIYDVETDHWKTISEKGVRDTDKVIQQVLRMDYETFINASFFLQGRADQFATQKPSDRKRILSNILGLDIWETYKEKAIEKRKKRELEVSGIDARMAEINSELAEEEDRLTRQQELEKKHAAIHKERESLEKQLTGFRRLEEAAKSQKKTADLLQNQLASARQKHDEQAVRLLQRQKDRAEYDLLLQQADAIQQQYEDWKNLRDELDRMNQLSIQASELIRKRTQQESILEKNRGALEQELYNLHATQKKISEVERVLPVQTADAKRLDEIISKIQTELIQKPVLENRVKELQHLVVEKNAENNRFNLDMKGLDSRRKDLEHVHDPLCPLCGQNLTTEHIRQLVEDITREGTMIGDQFRKNKAEIQAAEQEIANLELQLATLQKQENELKHFDKQYIQLKEQINQAQAILDEWSQISYPRLVQVETELSGELFGAESREAIRLLEADLNKLGYDMNAHDRIRQQEAGQREIETRFQDLNSARAKMESVLREIREIELQLKQMGEEITELEETATQAAAAYVEMSAQIPDLGVMEIQLRQLMDDESQVNQELGAARQKVDVLVADKKRLAALTVDRERVSNQIIQYKKLEQAFGKDGVPTLLIEQALPEIEIQANELLDRLSGGSMNIRFLTRRELKTRDEKKETLDILISDPNGVRDYELFSGGEAFRVNFAIRLALSRVLAQRAGARLQTLVIDEGFGSQDIEGRQRLIEAINLVKDDFVLILVITHLEELKDAFPKRIEVEKTPTGSNISVR